MLRITFSAFLICVFAPSLIAQEVVDPDEAKKDPDFAFQGEYVGEGTWPGAGNAKVGAQVIAQGDHKFKVVFHRHGLPGDEWKRGDDRLNMSGELTDGSVALTGKELATGRISDGSLTVLDADGKELLKLKSIIRKSPSLAAKPPKGALVLFDGTNVDHFPGATLTDLKTLEAGCKLKGQYKVKRVHLEFRLSWKPKARGQGRSNSGVFIGGLPEIQVLDSFGLEGAKNECGAFYSRRQPDVNMCLPPLVWQTYDVEFTQASPEENILATVRHNGVVIHKNHDTGKKESPLRGLSLQKHGNRVQYRNIWFVESK